MAPRSLCLIVNPSAGRGRAARLLPGVEQALRARGMSFRVERTHSLAHARELARGALAAGEVAAAMGGDGLLGAVAGELRGTDGVLGVLPGGRGNDFARKLGIGPDAERACDVLAAGRERAVDVAEADGRTYLGIASAGFDSDVQDIANATKLPLGELVYVYATLRALRGWRHARWQVVVDGEARSFDGYSVAVANSGVFGGGMYLVPDASLDDGLLDVVLTRAAKKRSYLAGLPKVFKGTHVDNPDLTFLRGREIAFHADRPFAAYADGDPIADLPVTIRIVPRALKVLVP
jgi:YegS/Rv2252/BmrU family lipid kinase